MPIFFGGEHSASYPKSSEGGSSFRRGSALRARGTAVWMSDRTVATIRRGGILSLTPPGTGHRHLHTILIVDDEWALAEVLSAILRDEGYRTLVAGNGREAEALLKSEHVDLVVADFLMPIMDAPALIAWMKREPALTGIPVIIMTSLPETEVR